jgi:hypothetical protein
VAPEPAEAALPVGFFDDASADAKARNTTVAEDKKAQFECVNVVVMLRVSVWMGGGAGGKREQV